MILSELTEMEDFGAFKTKAMHSLNEHAPVKEKSIRANEGPFMSKAVRKEHTHRTRLCNKYGNNRTDANLKAFNMQRNKRAKLLQKVKFDY